MTRLHIDRLDLDLHGISADTAEAAARALGPALHRELASASSIFDTAHDREREQIDAGRITSEVEATPTDLAERIARQIAQALRSREER